MMKHDIILWWGDQGLRMAPNGNLSWVNKAICTIDAQEGGILNIQGKEYRVYLANVKTQVLHGPNAGRDLAGNMHEDIIGVKHEFTLVEV